MVLPDAALLVGDGHDPGQRAGEGAGRPAPRRCGVTASGSVDGGRARGLGGSGAVGATTGQVDQAGKGPGQAVQRRVVGDVLQLGVQDVLGLRLGRHRIGGRAAPAVGRCGSGGRRPHRRRRAAAARRPLALVRSVVGRRLGRPLPRAPCARRRLKMARPRAATSSEASLTAASCPLRPRPMQGPSRHVPRGTLDPRVTRRHSAAGVPRGTRGGSEQRALGGHAVPPGVRVRARGRPARGPGSGAPRRCRAPTASPSPASPAAGQRSLVLRAAR